MTNLAESTEEIVRDLLDKKHRMIQEVFLRAVAEGWTKFYFWVERSPPEQTLVHGAAAFVMHCGPAAPDGVEHEVYDVAAIEAAIDNERGR